MLSSAMAAVAVFNLHLYLTLIILLEQQSSSRCHDVSSLYYIRRELHKATLVRGILRVIHLSAGGKLPQPSIHTVSTLNHLRTSGVRL